MSSLFCGIADGGQFGHGMDHKRRDKRCELYALTRQHFSSHFRLLDSDACQSASSSAIPNGIDMRHTTLLHGVDYDATIGSDPYPHSIHVQTGSTRANALRDYYWSIDYAV